MSGFIAIVGRPNVGKSALFNRIAGRRIAIVHDMPGVTRDRVTAEVEWEGRPFTLVDTGGIGLLRGEKSQDVIAQAALEQVQIAIEAASVIIFVVNVQERLVPLDLEVAKRLHEAGRPVLVAVNKTDHGGLADSAVEFSELGFARIFPVSAVHGRGIEELMDAAVGYLPPLEEAPVATEAAEAEFEEDEDAAKAKKKERPPFLIGTKQRPIRLAIVGRPNVGKSSIINSLTGSQRVIVSPIPGTTRDAVDVPFEVDTEGVRQHYLLIDTAGLRKARRVADTVELFSVERTRNAIERCDIAVLVIDAENGILEQDKKIGDLITEAKRACIIVVNKWDLVADVVRQAREAEIERRNRKEGYDPGSAKKKTTLMEFGEWVQEKLFFLDYAPVIFTSAKDGFQLDRLLEAVRYVAAQLRQQVPTAILNRTLQDAIEQRQPVSSLGHRLKLYYATQVRQSPPTFLLFANRDEKFAPTYEKYLAGVLRKAFGYEGCPLVLVPKARPKTIDPVRQLRPNKKRGKPPERHFRPKPVPKRMGKAAEGLEQLSPRARGRSQGIKKTGGAASVPRPATQSAGVRPAGGSRPGRSSRPGKRTGRG